MQDPAPVYPHSLIWRSDNRHPAPATLRSYLQARRDEPDSDAETWTPVRAR
ncbi:hypothetical protein HEK616_47180 [Streptomyces nigrescens]|uniref:LysR family transcriptional regulator n=1 Tax=Streptomyces nigrescens TaxID=1920 RepID=A0ABM7ZXZ5_STRNI|nr:hypothetical protein [Streptomyces nigrescens]BDM71231.1 hypothetical protein HEK616_47180 [Streptomyces nigrescens]